MLPWIVPPVIWTLDEPIILAALASFVSPFPPPNTLPVISPPVISSETLPVTTADPV